MNWIIFAQLFLFTLKSLQFLKKATQEKFCWLNFFSQSSFFFPFSNYFTELPYMMLLFWYAHDKSWRKIHISWENSLKRCWLKIQSLFNLKRNEKKFFRKFSFPACNLISHQRRFNKIVTVRCASFDEKFLCTRHKAKRVKISQRMK